MNDGAPNLKMITIAVGQLQGTTGDASEPYRDMLRQADVIFARDKASKQMVLFYGRDLLEDVARGRGSEFDDKQALVVELDISQDCPEIEFLYAAVEVLKGTGSCCYPRKGNKSSD